MLIQCEKCHQTYDVPEESLSSDRICLKCSTCGHVFYMEREEEPVVEPDSFEEHPLVYSEAENTENTPDKLDVQIQNEIHSDDLMMDERKVFDPETEISKNDDKPFLKDETNGDNPLTSPAFSSDKEDAFTPQSTEKKSALSLWVAAGLLGVILLMGMVLFVGRSVLYEQVEWMQPFYNLFDYSPAQKGASLENLRMSYIQDVQNRPVSVRLLGQIENQKKQKTAIPLIKACLLDEGEQIINVQYVPISREFLNPLEVLPFEVVLPLTEQAVYVDVSFDEGA